MRYPIVSFNAGEVSPLCDARSDIDKYRAACRTLENMIPLIYGAAERRPGTKYIETAGGAARALPFIYSDAIAYLILAEAGHFYFYYNGGRVLNGGGTRLDVATPYAAADLFALQYKQQNDVMWLTHTGYAQRKLSRTSATAFSLSAITFDNGPFMKRNDLRLDNGVTLAPSAIVAGANGTLTASSATFDSGHVGALFAITQPRVNTNVTGSKTSPATGVIGTSILIEGAFSFVTHGIWTGTVVLQRSIDNATWETYRSWTGNADMNVQYTGSEDEDDVYYRINVTAMSANTAPGAVGIASTVNCELSVNSSTQMGIARVTGYTSSLVVSMTVVKAFASTQADVRWAEGCWSAYRGYPRCATFFESRCVYAGTTYQPETVWLSAVDDYEDFEEGTNDDESFSLTLSSDERNAIQWISSLDALIVGTAGGEWRIRSNSFDEPLTPTNFSCRQQTNYGSKALQALVVNDAILFADRVGRKVRECSYDGNKDKYLARDLTALAEHITAGGIVSWGYQRNPDPILWAVTANGVLLSMTYEREQEVIAWARHPLRTGDLTRAVAVIPGSTEDEVWLVTYRSLNGSWVYCLEQMQPRAVTNQDDQWFVDCGLGYDGVATTTVSGGGHLEGEEVRILADGGVAPSDTVASGALTLAESASRVIVGLPFRYTLKPMRFDLQAGGTTKGTLKRFAELVVSFYRAVNVYYGVDTSHLFTVDFRGEEAYGTPDALYTGDKVVTCEGGFDVEDSIVLSSDDPTPCTVRALVPRIEMTGR